MSLLHSALVQVLRGGCLEGIKNPEGRNGTSGLRLGTSYVPVRRCLRSSMLPLSRLIDGIEHYTTRPGAHVNRTPSRANDSRDVCAAGRQLVVAVCLLRAQAVL